MQLLEGGPLSRNWVPGKIFLLPFVFEEMLLWRRMQRVRFLKKHTREVCAENRNQINPVGLPGTLGNRRGGGG